MLKNYNGLEHLKSMSIEELKVLAEDIRAEIINSVSENGGHIAPSLGVVELSIALHFVFNSPEDSIIWDVGHQAYAHKILTNRSLKKLRKKDGISGFPKPSESEHDKFIAGHSGISISQALALAINSKKAKAIAIIGDGSMTSGVAYEALNHAGSLKPKNLIVVLNDNEMSISKNVGAVSSFLNSVVNSSSYQKIKGDIKNMISSLPLQKRFNIDFLNLIEKARQSAINIIAPDHFFKTFGFRYVGPLDGHDLEVLIKFFSSLPEQEINTPLLFHVITKKGKGFNFAEDNPCSFHGVSAFDKDSGDMCKCTNALPSFTSVFSKTILELAEKDEKICAISAAMSEGTGLKVFSEKYPERFFDVGIAEQHAVTFSSGLAKTGLTPFTAIYSSFMQRASDQVIHDLAISKLPSFIFMDRSGLVGEDGATHNGVFDISLFRSIPNLVFMAPASANELKNMMLSYKKFDGPVLLRYPRGCVPVWESEYKYEDIEIGKARLVYDSADIKKYIAVFSIGVTTDVAIKASTEFKQTNNKLGIKVFDFRFIKPIDVKTICEEIQNASAILSIEDAMLAGGFSSAILETIVDNNYKINIPFKRLGIKDMFIEHASQNEQKDEVGIGKDAVLVFLKELSSFVN